MSEFPTGRNIPINGIIGKMGLNKKPLLTQGFRRKGPVFNDDYCWV